MVQLVTSRPFDVGTLVRISAQFHELGFSLTACATSQVVENDFVLGRQNSTPRSTKEIIG